MRKFIFVYLILQIICALLVNDSCAEETLSWNDCLSEAKKNNPQLIFASEAVKERQAGKVITASSLFPQINASAGGSTTETKTSGSDGGVAGTTTADSYSYGASASQLIFDGLKTINDIKGASEDLKGSQENYRFVSSEVRLALRSAFVSLLRAQELIQVTEEIVKIRRSNLELITLKYQSGLEHKGALLTAEANLAQAEFEFARAKRDIDFAQRQLIKEMGRKDFNPVRVTGDFTVRDSEKDKPDFDRLVKGNPSLLAAAAKKSAAKFGINSAYGNFSPQLSGSASVNKRGEHWPPQDKQWGAGLNVTMPVFEGGLRVAQVSQAKSIYNQREADERNTRDTLLVLLEESWAGLRNAVDSVVVQRKSLEATQERSRISEVQYSTGFITFDNWIIIENDLVDAKKSYLEAQANALYAEANWIQAKGETLEYAQ